MIVVKENERFYLTSWEYNASRIMTTLAKIVEDHGGRVKPMHSAVVSDRGLKEVIREKEDLISKIKNGKPYAEGNERVRNTVQSLERELENLKKVPREPITVTHTTYISFILNGIYYYYQLEENPFFDFMYIKTPINDGKYNRYACLETEKKDWLYDCFLHSGCAEADIVEAVNQIFNMLILANNSVIRPNRKKVRVNNCYDGGYHYEWVTSGGQYKEIDF